MTDFLPIIELVLKTSIPILKKEVKDKTLSVFGKK